MKVKDVIKKLADFNPNAEFQIIGYDHYPIPISEFNIGWSGDDYEGERDIEMEMLTCEVLTLFPDNEGCERID